MWRLFWSGSWPRGRWLGRKMDVEDGQNRLVIDNGHGNGRFFQAFLREWGSPVKLF